MLTDEERLAELLARNRTGGNVFMDGSHNPRPSEYKAAREFLASLRAQPTEERHEIERNAGQYQDHWLDARFHRQITPGHSIGTTKECWLCDEFREFAAHFGATARSVSGNPKEPQ